MQKIFLIGHGNIPLEEFMEKIRGKKVNLVIDIRSVPFSKYVSHFNQENLKKALQEKNISYLYMGDVLGGKQSQGFEKYIKSIKFKEALKKLQTKIKNKRSALMCSEIDCAQCHRKFIGWRLADMGIKVENILDKNKIQKIEQRTLAGFSK